MTDFNEMLNKFHNMESVEGMKALPENVIDLCITSPPYNVGIDYDIYDDNLPIEKYFEWTKIWLTELYRVLKDDGRVAINVPIEINIKGRGDRIFMSAEIWRIMKDVGFNFFGMVDLEEHTPHRVKHTAWGSWMAASGPYIYNPKECVILAYKTHSIKQTKGESQWPCREVMRPDKHGKLKKKKKYREEDKQEFMDLVFGRWKYIADKKTLTKATFSLDIPIKAIKILTYKTDVVMDPFSGSGTTGLACHILGRNFIGFELSPVYTEISKKRLRDFKLNANQLVIKFPDEVEPDFVEPQDTF